MIAIRTDLRLPLHPFFKERIKFSSEAVKTSLTRDINLGRRS